MELVLNNDDLLTEIIVRLPAKSLIRFKSVCRKWLPLISSDHLCHRHTLRHLKPQPPLILERDTRQLYYLNPTINGEKMVIPYSLSVPRHEIHQACNGLLLLHSERLRNSYYVYNPTTRQSRKISLTKSDKYPHVAGINLAFNPSKSPYYKIVCIRSTADSDSDDDPFLEQLTYQIEVYVSERHTWRLCLEPYTYAARTNFASGGVHWKNAIYWPSHEGYCYYDMAKNEVESVTSPRNPYAETFSFLVPYLQESEGRLYHVSVVEDGDESESVLVWELGGDDDSQWLFKYHHHTAGCANIVWFMGGSDGEGTSCSLLVDQAGKIRAYSFLDKTYEDLVDITFRLFNVYQFGEVLAVV